MKCPIDGSDLVMSDRQGIEIDYCPKCRGVWLDRGELDKIIERSAGPAPQQQPQHREERYREEPRRDERHEDNRGYQKPRKRESFLGELFDF